MVQSLDPYKYSKVSELPPSIGDIFGAVRVLIAGTNGTENRIQLLAIIHDIIMKDVNIKDIQPATLIANLVGCQLPSDVNIGCSALCAGSVMGGSDLNGITKCSEAVFLYNGSSFITLTHGTESGSGKAYVYVEEGFKSFKQSDIDALTRAGIKSVKIIVLSPDATVYKYISPDFVPIDTLLAGGPGNLASQADANGQLSSQSKSGSISPVSTYPESSNSSTVSWWWWVALIILLLILIGVGIYFARRQNAISSAKLAATAADSSEDMVSSKGLGDDMMANQTPNLSEFDYIGGMRPYSRY
jgi:hypothetical protein